VAPSLAGFRLAGAGDLVVRPEGSRQLQRALLIPLVVLAWLGLLLIVAWLLGHVTRALLIVILAALIAFALTPLVNLLARWMPRVIAVALSYTVGFIVVFGLLGVVVATAGAQLISFGAQAPAELRQAQGFQQVLFGVLKPLGVTAAQLAQVEAQAVSQLQHLGTTAANSALGVVQMVLGAVVDGVLILILSVYLAASGPRLVQWMHWQAPTGQRRRTTVLVGIVNQVVGGYIRGTLILATLIGVLVGVGMALLHVRYALLLGILAFFMEFVPVLGVMVSGVVCVVVALFTGWLNAVFVAIYFVVVHVIEGDVVGPRIMGKAVGIHPGVAIVALVAGSELFGIWGALFGAPLAGLVQAIVVAGIKEMRLARAGDATQLAEVREAEEEGKTMAEGRTNGPTDGRLRTVLTTVARARRHLRPAQRG
jgi:predicted PurR-regulated permease PerM